MTLSKLLRAAQASGQSNLDEYASKRILEAYGIPVVTETVVELAASTTAAAETIGYPVVLKALGVNLLHKTERGLVHLNLKKAAEVSTAADSISRMAGDDLQGYVVQQQLAGKRELMAGMFKDPQFGPVVMFGIGGIFTEALADVSFRLAPLTEFDAASMLGEIRGGAILGSFRGDAEVSRDQIIQALMGLSRLAIENPMIEAVDINPIIASSDGDIRAVDALIFLNPAFEPGTSPAPIPPEAIGSFFYPKSIAFVGASAQVGKWGHMLLLNTLAGGYAGQIFLVNPKGGTIMGRKAHQSVKDLPEAVDLAIVTIPARRVFDLIPEFEEKGIRKAVLITSGFGESGTAGKKLERSLVAQAKAAGILLLGPNTMGICNPHARLYCTGAPISLLAGSTAMVAQSGNMGTQLLAFAEAQGIGIRAFCGSGNEAMIAIEDYLDSFEIDELTRIVMLYIESVKNGRRFFEGARRVGRKKPIILLKGGQSPAGNRAAASHTGAMATDVRVFDAVCRQAGVVKVDHPMDLLDLAAAFSSLPLPQGNRAAIMTLGGGWGVVAADLCSAHGIEIPKLSPALMDRFNRMLPPFWSRANPVDIVGERDPSIPLTIMSELLAWDGCDGVINLGILGRRVFGNRMADAILKIDPDTSEDFVMAAKQFLYDSEKQYIEHIVNLMEKYQKPIYGVSLLKGETDQTVYRVGESPYKGVFYETPERAIKAFARMVEYARFVNRAEPLIKA